jgi:hypothetical protein
MLLAAAGCEPGLHLTTKHPTFGPGESLPLQELMRVIHYGGLIPDIPHMGCVAD